MTMPSRTGYSGLSMSQDPTDSGDFEDVPLQLGDEFQAIRHLAKAQSNPLKSIAELVENSIDAGARHCWIVRSLEGEGFLRVSDDGAGVSILDGRPDFKRVLQRIGDSIKTKLAPEDREGVKGEFGLGLLGFYALGERLIVVSKSRLPNGSATKSFKMMVVKDIQKAKVWTAPEPVERPRVGVDVTVEKLTLPVQRLSSQKIRDYLSTELRGRLTDSKLELTIREGAEPEIPIKPRVYRGTRFSKTRVETRYGPLLLDLYLCPPTGELDVKVSIGVKGTKVYDRIDSLPGFGVSPWISGKVQGIIDYPAARPTPNRTELEPDKFYDELVLQLQKLAPVLKKQIRDLEQELAKKEDRVLVEDIRRLFQQAFDDLPRGHYALFETHGKRGSAGPSRPGKPIETSPGPTSSEEEVPSILSLDTVCVEPGSTEILRGEQKYFRARPLDIKGREVTRDLVFAWETRGGMGIIEEFGSKGLFTAGTKLGEGRIIVRVSQGDIGKTAEAAVAVVEKKRERNRHPRRQPGIPSIEPVRDNLSDWHSRFVENRNVIEYNAAHRDYLQVAGDRRAKRVYIATLVTKEIVNYNTTQGFTPNQVLEEMVEVISSVHRALK